MTKQKNEYLLTLGAGTNQVPFIETAKAKGYLVIGVDQNINAPGLDLCDIKIEESLRNYRKIVYKLQMNILEGPIKGVICASYGEAVLSWSYIAEKLRIIGPNRVTVEILLDKYETRKKLESVTHPLFRMPNYYCPDDKLQKSKLTEIGYPMIIKPRRGHGKANIFEFKDYTLVQSFFTKKNLHQIGILPRDLIIEEKIQGDEITATGFVQDFEYTLIALTDKVTSQEAPFVEMEHRYPSKHRQFAGQIREIHQKIAEAVQLGDCPVVSEWKIVEDKLYLIEFSLQPPGEFLAPFLIPKAANYNYYENFIRVCIGEKIEKVPPYTRTKKGSIRFLPEKPKEMELKRIQKKSDFFFVVNENPGNPPRSNHDRYAATGILN